MKTKATLIAGHPFWQGLRIEFLPPLVAAATIEQYGIGDYVFQERQSAQHFYLLHHGQVALETFVPGRGMVTLQSLSAGDALGWSWFFPPYTWQVSARSVDATEIIAFAAESLRALAAEKPDFGRELVTRMGQVLLCRLEATRHKLEEFTYPGRNRKLDDCLRDMDEEEAEPYIVHR